MSRKQPVITFKTAYSEIRVLYRQRPNPGFQVEQREQLGPGMKLGEWKRLCWPQPWLSARGELMEAIAKQTTTFKMLFGHVEGAAKDGAANEVTTVGNPVESSVGLSEQSPVVDKSRSA